MLLKTYEVTFVFLLQNFPFVPKLPIDWAVSSIEGMLEIIE